MKMDATSPAKVTTRWRRGIWVVFIAIVCFSGLLDMADILSWPNLRQPLSPPNPDSWLRLAVVKQWLSGGGFFNHLVTGTNAPIGGISIHWTRPLDIVLAFFAQLMPAANLNMKLLLAACWYPVCLAIAAAATMARGAEKIFRHSHVLACVLLLMIASPYMPDYFKPGDADHHGMMSLLWCGAVVLLLDKTISRCRAFAAGLLLGLIVWMSPEGLLMFAACLAVAGFDALVAPPKDNKKIETVLFLALGAACMTTTGLFFEVPVAEIFFRQTYDSLSIVQPAFLWLASTGAAFLCLLWQFARTIAGRAYLVTATGVSVALLMYALYPKFFLGPFVDADPFVFTDFLPMVGEAQPLFHSIKISILRDLMEPVMGVLLLGSVFFSVKSLRKERRDRLLKLSGLFCFTFALALYQQRFLYYCEPVTIIICAGLLPAITIGWRKFGFAPRRWQPYLWFVLAFAITMGCYLSPVLMASAKPNSVDGTCLLEMRQAVQTGQLQKLLGDKNLILYTFEDVGGEVLFFTPYRIIASNYHREAAGMKDMKAIRESTTIDELHGLLKKRQVDAMLFCPAYHTKKQILHSIADDKKRPKWLTSVTGMIFMKKEGFKPVLLRVKK